MHKEDFVTYKQAIALKKLGFDTETYLWYAEYANTKELFGLPTPQGDVVLRNWNSTLNQISAPTLTQDQKWLEKEKNLIICVSPESDFIRYNDNPIKYKYIYSGWCVDIFVISPDKELSNGPDTEQKLFSSSDKALSDGITVCLNFLETKKSNQ